ncbi:SIR2 family NAD-dependent protein deacylase [Glycomyces algeriensis]|uniref:protein acetyllysine N-acetyltransferase n=1 Tax=Glycomyces algeriensis TaxID=256037 RepID=A0A9W6G9R3_9ACTN|nr:NAD-dependent deacylase [Glycomyces algeriensis]MDA1365511.1 NAD-dependent deacylase [Glycomyces algeriensis]MDR7351197.1 NAD-dependent deacetylase [Glycomyces algeriensis]GLI43910.1 NAD-dependent protein deacetylase 2 [Glycomyces algeriensis]
MSTTSATEVARWFGEASSITVLTGAGVSTDSGIPDFRGPQGVWTKNPAAEKMFTIDNYLADPEVRRQAWAARRVSPLWTAQPNTAHRALAEFERTGRLRAVITQNTDGLHQAAGSDPASVIEIHGTARDAACLACGDRMPMTDVLPRLEAGETDPPCPACGGILKSATVSFGQQLDGDVLEAAADATREADLFAAVGTSLGVYPAAGLCDYALAHGARLVILNAEPTPYDEVADAVLREPIGEALPLLLGVSA